MSRRYFNICTVCLQTGDAVADGGSISFNHFDLFRDITQDDLEKVIWAQSCSDTLKQLACTCMCIHLKHFVSYIKCDFIYFSCQLKILMHANR